MGFPNERPDRPNAKYRGAQTRVAGLVRMLQTQPRFVCLTSEVILPKNRLGCPGLASARVLNKP
jgi:hypothetical protein